MGAEMRIETMKRALQLVEVADELALDCAVFGNDVSEERALIARCKIAFLEAIAAAEKQELVAIGEEWKPCVKLPIVVHVREQRKSETHVSTREGITPVKEDDLIMRGVAGEEYPIGRELFNRTYTFDTAQPKREWVSLTEEEIFEATDLFGEFRYGDAQGHKRLAFAQAIEAKLREKNKC